VPRSLDTLLADLPFFAGLEPERLTLLAGCAGNTHFSAGDYLFRQGEPADVFYVVRQGSVALETFVPTRGPVLIETIEAGEVIGWSWLFPPYRWHLDARALTDVRATGFDGACLRGKCEADPTLGYALLQRVVRVMSTRLHSARVRLLDLYGTRS
jgi:CRP/FNR family cyclic AMP-dependent transcriptional regulator